MKWFTDLKIQTKLISSFIVVAFIAAVIGYTGISNMSLMNDNAQQMYNDRTVPIVEASNALQELYELRLAVAEIVTTTDPARRTTLKEEIQAVEKKEEEAMKKFAATNLGAEEKRLYEEYRNSWEGYKPEVEATVKLALSGDIKLAQEIESGKFDLISKRLTEELDSVIISEEHLADSLDQEIAHEYSAASLETEIFLGFGVVLAIGLGFFIARMISKPVILISERVKQLKGLCVTNLGSGLEALSHGDTTYDVVTGTPFLEITTKDEIGDLARDVDGIITQTRASVSAFEKSRQTVNELISEAGILTQAAL
ncbi:MAG TPA: MCP four helix bundle domain-containing protein, partial [Bacteroidota bacterium]|nr:MCP four helix bundle domain-containing protein [Bacteroidota bacterium]